MMEYKLGIRGEVCPYPLLLTVEKIERMKRGDSLKVLTDYPLAIQSISREMEIRKLEYIVTKRNSEWEIKIKK